MMVSAVHGYMRFHRERRCGMQGKVVLESFNHSSFLFLFGPRVGTPIRNPLRQPRQRVRGKCR